MNWSEWTPLCADPAFSEEGLRETLDGGQMFRFNPGPDGIWTGVWGRCVARIRVAESGDPEASFPAGTEACALPALRRLLALDLPYGAYFGRLRSGGDSAMGAMMDACAGLRVVRQPLGDALLGFLCSPMKRIPQIKQSMERLAGAFGDELIPGVHALPTWERLADVGEEALRACRLGYRAKSIAGTARMLAGNPGFLDGAAALPYAGARAELMRLPGVGGKIADCVLLYSGTAALEPFPVDTWILRAMANLYGLGELPPETVARFGRERFGDLAGLAQQFLFVHIRHSSGRAA